MKNKFILIITILTLSSCYKDLEVYNPDNFQPKIAFFAFFRPDTNFVIKVSKTDLPAQLDTSDFIQNATVEIYANNSFIEYAKHIKNPYYLTTYKPVQSDIITIKVSAINQTAYGSGKIPPKPTLKNLKLNSFDIIASSYFFDTIYYYNAMINLTIEIDTLLNNYFAIILYNRMINYYLDTADNPVFFTDTISYHFYEEGTEAFSQMIHDYLAFFNRQIAHPYGFEKISVFDKSFLKNGKITIYSNIWAYSRYNSDTLYFILISLSEDLYKYYQSIDKYLDTRDIQYLEPVSIYSNVQGGIGLVAGYNYDKVYPIIIENIGNQLAQ